MLEIISNCPSCGTLLERVKDQLFCRNSNCAAQSSKAVEHYAKIMKIKGLGPKTVESLNLTEPREIYEPETQQKAETILGQKLASKLIAEIEKSKEVNFEVFLEAMGIPHIGNGRAKKLAEHVNSIEEINAESCNKAGLGPVATSSILGWVKAQTFNKPMPITFKCKVAKKQTDIKVCITGKLSGYTKAKAADLLSSLNIATVNSVTKDTTYLICDKPKGSAKEKKAEALGIEILSFNTLLEKYKNV